MLSTATISHEWLMLPGIKSQAQNLQYLVHLVYYNAAAVSSRLYACLCSMCILFVHICACTAAYADQFRRLPNHRLAVSYSDRSVVDDLVTVEECARRCLLAADRACHSFNYKPAAHYRRCMLLHVASDARLPAVYTDDTDLYQRQSGSLHITYYYDPENSAKFHDIFMAML